MGEKPARATTPAAVAQREGLAAGGPMQAIASSAAVVPNLVTNYFQRPPRESQETAQQAADRAASERAHRASGFGGGILNFVAYLQTTEYAVTTNYMHSWLEAEAQDSGFVLPSQLKLMSDSHWKSKRNSILKQSVV